MLGVDDYSSDDEVKIIPRLPASWDEMEARGWPVRGESPGARELWRNARRVR